MAWSISKFIIRQAWYQNPKGKARLGLDLAHLDFFSSTTDKEKMTSPFFLARGIGNFSRELDKFLIAKAKSRMAWSILKSIIRQAKYQNPNGFSFGKARLGFKLLRLDFFQQKRLEKNDIAVLIVLGFQ